MNHHISQSFVNSIVLDGKTKTYWDDKLSGFGVRTRKKSMSYLLKYRNKKRIQCLYIIGKVGNIKADAARELATKALGDIARGLDPAHIKQTEKNALTVSELCDWYLQAGTDNKKEVTKKDDRGRIKNHILPILGNRIVKDIKRGDITQMMHLITSKAKIPSHNGQKRHGHFPSGGAGVARRTLGLLGAIFEFALSHDVIENNPCRGIKRASDNKREAFLTLDDVKVLGKIMDSPELVATHKDGLNIIKLILLTGCRREEIAALKWEFVDFEEQCFRFADTKTGKQTRPFGLGALHLLSAIHHNQKTGYVFPSTKGEGYNRTASRTFDKIRSTKNEETGEYLLRQDITIHGLRHSFASIAANLGYSDFTIAGLLGHSLHTITSRYMHTVDKSLVRAADAISLKIESALSGKNDEAEVINISKIA